MNLSRRFFFPVQQKISRLLTLAALVALLVSACDGQPTLTATMEPSFTPRPTLTTTPQPSSTPSPTATVTNTPPPPPTPTIAPVSAGTALPAEREPIQEANLDRLRELGRWGNGRVEGLAWSPDGQLVAVATPLGLYLYNADGLARRAAFDTSAPASNPAFSPDSSLVAAAITIPGELGASAVLVWSVAEGRLVQTLPAPGRIMALAFSQDMHLAVLTRLDSDNLRGAALAEWTLPGGESVRTLALPGGEVSEDGALSSDFSLAATRGPNGPVRLWRLTDGANFATTQETGLHAGPMAFAPGGSLDQPPNLAIGYTDTTRDYRNQNEVRVWRVPRPGDVQPATRLHTLSDSVRARGPNLAEGMEQTLLSIAWSPDGRLLAAGYEDRTVRAWEIGSTAAPQRMAATTLPLGLVFSPQSDRLAAGGIEIFQLGSLPANSNPIAATNDFLPGLNDLALSPSGNFVALAGYGQIEVRHAEDGTRTYIIAGMDGPVNAVDISPDGILLVAACQDGTTRLYRMKDGLYLDSLGVAGFPVLSAAFAPNGRWVASGNESMLIQIFRVQDSQLMLGLKEPYVSYRLLFAPNVDQLASLTTSGVWLRSFGGEIQKIETELEGMAGGVGLSDMAYSPGEEHLALVGNGVVRVIDPVTHLDRYVISTQSSSLPENVLPWSVAFSPDNAFLAVGWSDGSIRFYWAADGALMAVRPGHSDAVIRLAFARDGRTLLSLGAEGTIRLWGVSGE